jgi:DnaD/phage-associated family protein
MAFKGFQAGGETFPLPEQFFSELLHEVDDLAELKVSLWAFYRLHQQDGPVRCLRLTELETDQALLDSLQESDSSNSVRSALDRAEQRGTLLAVDYQHDALHERLYFLNTPRSKAAMDGLNEGRWTLNDLPELNQARLEKPNIYALYESHVGPLTPMLAESLQEAETTYPAEWIEDAFRIAVENNVRRWRYIEAILKSWQEQGRDDRRDSQSAEKERRKYVEGEFARFIDH